MKMVPTVRGNLMLRMHTNGMKKMIFHEVEVNYNHGIAYREDDEDAVWLPEEERLKLVDPANLSHRDYEKVKDRKTSYAGDSEPDTYCDCGSSLLHFHLVSAILPQLGVSGIVGRSQSYYRCFDFYCDDEQDYDKIRKALLDATDSFNKQYGTDYTLEFNDNEVKAPKFFKHENPPKDRFGTDIEVGDIVSYSAMQDTGCVIRQVVSLTEKKVILDNGGSPFIENITVVQKANGTPVDFGY